MGEGGCVKILDLSKHLDFRKLSYFQHFELLGKMLNMVAEYGNIG